MKYLKLASLIVLSSSLLSDDNINFDHLLSEFTQKSDLSKNTKLSNVGHSIIFTRDDLDKMQARNLKDIIKGLPLMTYQENRFGFANIRNIGSLVPFSSSSVRVYLDDHEMVSGAYGSGFALFGNIELEFVDHIEVYYNAPSFEYSVESTSLLIKLHTKVPERDKGGKVLLSAGSKGYNQESAFYSDKVNDISYFAYVSNLDNKRDDALINEKEVSKDNGRKHLLATVYDKNNHILLDSQKFEQTPLSNLSVDGTASNSSLEQDNLQISYINSYFNNVRIKASYQKSYNSINFKDDNSLFGYPNLYDPYVVTDFLMEYDDSVYTSEVNYGHKTSSNKFFIGANTRMKKVDLIGVKHNNLHEDASSDYDRQNISSVFAQDELTITDNSIITAGGKYSEIDNNGGVDDHNFSLYRIGYIYNKNSLTSKVFYYHTPNLVEPYLYSSWFNFDNKKLKPEVSDMIYTQLEYEEGKNYASIMYGHNEQENTLYYNPTYMYIPLTRSFVGSIDNATDLQKTNFINFNYKYSLNSLNSIATNYFINFNDKTLAFDRYRQHGGYIRFLNTIGKVDLFNEIIYREDSIEKHATFDYSTGIKYKHTDSLFFSVKGENLFDKAYNEKIRTLDYSQIVVGESSPIDRRIYTTLEYMF